MTTLPDHDPSRLHPDDCACCTPALSRRGFLRAAALGAVATPVLTSMSACATGVGAESIAAGQPILIKGGCVLSLDRGIGDFEQADVLVEGSKIAAVRPNITAPNAAIIDARNTIVMPGFVDTHRHMWQGILRNILPDGSLQDYIRVVQRMVGQAYTPDDVYAGNLSSALGCIDVGVTTVLDWSHIHMTPAHTDAAIKGLQESGVRAVFAYGTPQHESGDWTKAPNHRFPGDIARLRKQFFSTEDQLLTLFLASPGGTPEAILPTWRAARDVGARITIHVGVGEFGRNALLERLHKIEPLRSDTTYIHCCTLNDTEWKLIRDSGGTVSIAGYVETLMGHGNPPTQRAIDFGVRPSLSVDVETSVPNDFFTQMRTVLSLQKNEVWARRLAGQKDAGRFLTAREVLEFATIEGAKANGLERKVGSLTPGKEADIILLRTDRLNVMPMNNAVGAVVTSMGPQNVDTVLIGGRIKKRHGELVGVDMARITRVLDAARERALANGKYPRNRV